MKPKNDRFVNFQPRSCLHKEGSEFIFFNFRHPIFDKNRCSKTRFGPIILLSAFSSLKYLCLLNFDDAAYGPSPNSHVCQAIMVSKFSS